jgi:hypothetical protein
MRNFLEIVFPVTSPARWPFLGESPLSLIFQPFGFIDKIRDKGQFL